MCNDAEISLDSLTGDWITVGELTPFEISVWKFPNTKICPLRSCALVCETRDLTIKHYKEEHAKHSALCKICKYPLMLLKGAHHFLTHFARKHPGMPAPLKVKDFQIQCSQCNSLFKTFSSLQNHEKKFHHKITKNPLPSQVQLIYANEEPLEVPSSTQTGEKSPSWEDMDTDQSDRGSVDAAAVDAAGAAVDDSRTVSRKRKTNQTKQTNFLRQLIERKSGLFKPRPRAFTCTICEYRGLKNYVMARNHYRKKHGRDVSMCKHCDRFFTNSVAYIHHMIEKHPRMSISSSITAKNSENRVKKIAAIKMNVNEHTDKNLNHNLKNLAPISESRQNDHYASMSGTGGQIGQSEPSAILHAENGEVRNDNNENDSILVGEKTDYPPKLYRFPSGTKKCPKIHCFQKFLDRQSMINHYRMKHAQHDILCPECDTLITVSSHHYLKSHFNRKHPNCALPLKKTEFTSQVTENDGKTNDCQTKLDATLRVNVDHVEQSETERLPRCNFRSIQKPMTGPVMFHNQHVGISQSQSQSQAKSISNVTVNIKSSDLISTIDLSQDDGFLEQLEENPTPALPEHKVTCPRLKKSNTNDKLKQSTLANKLLMNKRSCRARSIGTRHKACTICGFVLSNYVNACDHYRRNHGRNVLMCPYCEIFFLQSALLTKHVLAEHSRDEVGVEMITGEKPANNSENDTTNVGGRKDDTIDTIATNFDALDDIIPEPVQPVEMAQYTAPIDNSMPNDDEPLNLTVQHYDVIDLTVSGVLDLSMRK